MSSYHYLRGTEDDAKRDQEFLDKIDREGARAPRIRQVKTTSDISSDWDLFETLNIIWILHKNIGDFLTIEFANPFTSVIPTLYE